MTHPRRLAAIDLGSNTVRLLVVEILDGEGWRPIDLDHTAGTVTTLAALDLDLAHYDAARVQDHRMDRRAVERLRDRLSALDLAARAGLPCLEPGRADLIVPGVAIVLVALEVLGAPTLAASDWGLREGIMAEAVDILR